MKELRPMALQLGVVFLAAVIPALAGTSLPTPEPASVLLIGAGLGGLILYARHRRAKK